MDARQINYVSFHFNPYIVVYDRQTDKIHFISLLILGCKETRRTTYVSFNPQSTKDKRTIELRQTDKLFSPPILESPQDKQTDKLCFISPIMVAFMTDRRTKYVSFHSSYWDSNKTRRTTSVSFNPQSTQNKRTIELRQTDKLFFNPDIGINAKPTDGHTMFNFTNYVGIYDRRTKYVSFHSSYWDSRKIDGQLTFHLTLNLRKTNEQ